MNAEHYPEILARVEPEADDAEEVKYLQLELLSDQVLTEAGAGAGTCAI